ncbi:MAG: hypothetical protein ACOX8S_04105 [Christensenellales bacterium]|jgi:hypothetical protein
MDGKMTNTQYLLHAVELGKKIPGRRGRMRGSAFLELAKMELNERGLANEEICYENIDGALNWIDQRNDCADFLIPALVRMLHQHRNTPRLDEAYAQKIEDSLVGFKYWLDEPGEVHACYFTENHQILFHSAEYLVGQLFPDRIFPSNGKDGNWHRQHAIPFIRRWIDWRTRFGFSEWLTNGYYCEDILAMLGLMIYADEEDLRLRCRMIVDTLLFDVAVNGFKGYLCGTHGRVYARTLVDPDTQGITPVMGLSWGEGYMDGGLSDCATMMAIYDYKCPDAIAKAALSKPEVLINKERMSINVSDAKYYGADPADFDNIMLFWGIQAYSDRLVVENSTKVFPYWNWMLNRVYAYKEMYELHDQAGAPCVDAPDYTSMTEVNIYTYKTPDYMLSCAQDFRKGRMGYQQHPWTASLGGRAQVFTNSPASNDYISRPNQIAGNLNLPRAVAHNNVQLCIYRINPDFVDYLYSHCYFPQHEFDEVAEKYGWVFGRKENGYIAVRSLRPARWLPVNPQAYRSVYFDPQKAEEMIARAKPFDYMAPGHANVWAVELGSKAQNGSFEQFMTGFENAAITGDSHNFTYNSPSQGEMKFGWTCPLNVNGQDIGLRYKRYDNPFCQAEFNTGRLEIRAGGSLTVLDHDKLERLDS